MPLSVLYCVHDRLTNQNFHERRIKLHSLKGVLIKAVLWDRFSIAKALSEMGADIHWTCEASMIHGNALGVARSL